MSDRSPLHAVVVAYRMDRLQAAQKLGEIEWDEDPLLTETEAVAWECPLGTARGLVADLDGLPSVSFVIWQSPLDETPGDLYARLVDSSGNQRTYHSECTADGVSYVTWAEVGRAPAERILDPETGQVPMSVLRELFGVEVLRGVQALVKADRG